MLCEDYVITEVMDRINEGKDIPKRVEDFKIKWVAADGWRGYYEATPFKNSGWIEVKNSWVTGDFEGAPEDVRASNVDEMLEKLANKVEKLGGEMRVIFLPSSNLFAAEYQVFIRGIDIKDLED